MGMHMKQFFWRFVAANLHRFYSVQTIGESRQLPSLGSRRRDPVARLTPSANTGLSALGACQLDQAVVDPLRGPIGPGHIGTNALILWPESTLARYVKRESELLPAAKMSG